MPRLRTSEAPVPQMAERSPAEEVRLARGRALAVVTVLGLHAWACLAGLPAALLVSTGALRPLAAAMTLVCLLPLAAGLVLLARRSRSSAWALALAFPAGLLLPALAQPAMVGPSLLTPAAIAVASLGFVAYLLAACWASARVDAMPLHTRPVPSPGSVRSRRIVALSIVLPLAAALTAAVVIGAASLRVAGPEDPSATSHELLLATGSLTLWVVAILAGIVPFGDLRPRPLARPSRGAAVAWILVLAIATALLLLCRR